MVGGKEIHLEHRGKNHYVCIWLLAFSINICIFFFSVSYLLLLYRHQKY